MVYLVTKDAKDLGDFPVVMVDGTVPGWSPKEGDLHFDHHRPGGADTQIQEIGLDFRWESNPDTVFVTTMLDADAAAAAAWVQLSGTLDESQAYEAYFRLLAIAYDCDCLGLPQDSFWDSLREFARNAVASLKLASDQLAHQLGLPADRKAWSERERLEFGAKAFEACTEWLIAAARGRRPWPGELGEAEAYWRQYSLRREQVFPLIYSYRECALLDLTDFGYIDPRIIVEWAIAHNCGPVTLTYRRNPQLPNGFPYDGETYSYTLGSVPLHPHKPDYSESGVWEALSASEKVLRKIWGLPPLQTVWGGRASVGGSPFQDPCVSSPDKVIDTVLACLARPTARRS